MTKNKIKQGFIQRQAAKDIVHLFSGESSPQSEARIIEKSSNSDQYRKELESYQDILSELDILQDDQDITRLIEKYDNPDLHSELNSSNLNFLGLNSIWLKLAACICIVAIGLVSWLQLPSHQQAEKLVKQYTTNIGEQKTIALDDGSKITLNTGTQLLVDINDTTRRVIMERGEAYYKIAKDKQRPFEIDLGERTVVVLGTEFNIKKSPDTFTLSVTEGLVSIHPKNKVISSPTELLEVNDKKVEDSSGNSYKVGAGTVVKFNYNKRILSAHHEKEIEKRVSWKTGLMSFNNEPLHKVIAELNRYSSKKILIQDSGIMDLPVRGTVKINNINSALMGLENSLPINIVSYFDRVVITGK
jgi:transmembrane sensor